MRADPLLSRLSLEHPIFLAPMGGGPSTPELVAAVSNAGGLGAIGAAYLSPQQILDHVRKTRALTSRAIHVNLFCGGYTVPAFDPGPMLEILSEVHALLGIPAPVAPAVPKDPFPDQFAAVLEARPEVFSFTFGTISRSQIQQLRERDIQIWGTATTVEEARIHVDAGVDAIAAQGAEAGAHRGTFAGPFETSMIPTAQLVREIASFATVVAAGGMMDGGDVRAMIELGASAAQLGTAFLPCPESGAPPAHKQALLAAATDRTVITRAFSGRPARGLRNDFIAKLEGREGAILPYPVQNVLTRAMRTAAAQQGRAEFLSLWAGQGVTRCRELPVSELYRQFVNELG